MRIGYARISTDDQSLDLQRDALRVAGCETVFEDVGNFGRAARRPGLDAAVARIGIGDVLVVWRLDRLGRSLFHLIEIIRHLGERGAGFASLSENIDTTTAGGKLILQVMSALAEFERSMSVERVTAGIVAAKRRGKHIGRPRKLTPEQISHAREAIDQGLQTQAGMAAVLGVDHTTLWRNLRKDTPLSAPMPRKKQMQRGQHGRD